MKKIILISMLVFTPFAESLASGSYEVHNPETFRIGLRKTYVTEKKDTLIELARRFDLGYNEIISANRYIDPWVPGDNTLVIIPTEWVLPDVSFKDIVINLAEMRLYYFTTIGKKRSVMTFPVGIGRQGYETPTGLFRVAVKVENPVWKVPENIRKEKPELLPFVYPGNDNPLGRYWLQLSGSDYGIHGTNEPFGIGRKVSHGCVRLYPEDIELLYKYVRPGTKVNIINAPVKIARDNSGIYMEVHNNGMSHSELLNTAIEKLRDKGLLELINPVQLISTISKSTGLPEKISP